MNSTLRSDLVATALRWEQRFGNAPSITTVLSQYDAAMLIGMSQDEYSEAMAGAITAQKGYNFESKGERYQGKGNRPSGKPGSNVAWVPKATNYDWDHLIWILYAPATESWRLGSGTSAGTKLSFMQSSACRQQITGKANVCHYRVEANLLAQAERERQANRPRPMVRGTFSPVRAWRPAVVARLARTLGV